MSNTTKILSVDDIINLTMPSFLKNTSDLDLVDKVYLKQVDQLKRQLLDAGVSDEEVLSLPDTIRGGIIEDLNNSRIQVAEMFFNDLEVVIRSTKDFINVNNSATVDDFILESYDSLVTVPFKQYRENSIEDFEEYSDKVKSDFESGFITWWEKVQEDPEAAYKELFLDEKVKYPISKREDEMNRSLEQRIEDLNTSFDFWLEENVLERKSQEDLLYINRSMQALVGSNRQILLVKINSEKSRIQNEQQYSQLINLIKEQNDTIESLKNEALVDSFVDNFNYDDYSDEVDALLENYEEMTYDDGTEVYEESSDDFVDDYADDDYLDTVEENVEEEVEDIDPLSFLDDDDDSDPFSLDDDLVSSDSSLDDDSSNHFSDDLDDIPSFDDFTEDSSTDLSFGDDDIGIPSFEESNVSFEDPIGSVDSFENQTDDLFFVDDIDDSDDFFDSLDDDDDDDSFITNNLEFEPVDTPEFDDDVEESSIEEKPKKKRGLFKK